MGHDMQCDMGPYAFEPVNRRKTLEGVCTRLAKAPRRAAKIQSAFFATSQEIDFRKASRQQAWIISLSECVSDGDRAQPLAL